MTILITGASGFIGSFAVERALKEGFETWAGVRRSSSRRYLQDERIHFAELDLSDVSLLRRQLVLLKAEMGGRGWDYVVHAAGATKCRKKEAFFTTNTEGTQHLVEALQAEGMTPRRFVFLSSLSVFGAIREQAVRESSEKCPWVYNPIRLTDTPKPNTAYGQSKRKAEQMLQATKGFPYVILRPTGVYGPREKDYFLMAQSIRRHVDFSVGYRRQEITFLYVEDLVSAIFLALKAEGVDGRAYFLSDGKVYGSRQFSDLLQAELGIPFVWHIKAPLWFLKVVCIVMGALSGLFGRTSTLNRDKYHILSQRNWQCDLAPACRELHYAPQWTLSQGVHESVKWYKENKWLNNQSK